MKRILNFSCVIMLMAFCTVTHGQRIDWSKVDLSKEYKRNGKVPGGVAKSLKNTPSFISDYKVTKYVEQKGSNSKGGGAAIFSHAGLIGIEDQAYQEMVNDLYAHFKTSLENAGIIMANAGQIANSENAKSIANGKNEFAGNHPGGPKADKTAYGDKVDIYRPTAPLFYTDGIAGLFYSKLMRKEDVNIINVQYVVQFAGFEQARGYKSKSLSTFPLLVITPIITISNAKGQYAAFTYGKALYGNNDWSKGVEEVKSKNGSLFGLSSSADYAIRADQAAYIKEVSDVVKAVQKNIIEALREEMM